MTMSWFRQVGLHALERLVALVLLLSVVPCVLVAVVGITWSTGDWPAVIADEVVTSDGRLARSLRFRTAGPSSASFHAVGRWLRRYRIDELPALWSVARGELKLRDALTAFWRV
jgi:lipopolysaccharide/colanic/teichoic acid biosynthesis glycosyltransferase